MAQKHNAETVNAPMTRNGGMTAPEANKRIVRGLAYTASQLSAENPVLQLGEIGYETDTNMLKVGDGTTKWNDLPYAGGGSSLPTQTGHSGEFLTTDGTDASWGAVSQVPSTTGATQGDVLTVDSGGDAAWAAAPSGLPDQTGQSGKFLTTDGTDASWSDKPLQNTATGTNSLTLLGNASAGTGAINIGTNSTATGSYSVAIGNGSQAKGFSVAIGYNAQTTAPDRCIQIGQGSNGEQYTMNVGLKSDLNVKLLSSDGTIPAARHASLPAADGTYVLKLVIASGVQTLSWVAE